MIQELRKLRKFNWPLFISLCALSLLPAIYQTIKTFIISTSNDNNVFNILGQMEWYDLINETLIAFLIIPLYSILNKIKEYDENSFSQNVFKTGLITFISYSIFSLIVIACGKSLIWGMNENDIDLSVTYNYLILETIAFIVGVIITFINVVFVIIGKAKNFYILLGVKTFLSIIFDFILIPHLGVYGVAISNIIVNTILGIVSSLILVKEKAISLCLFKKDDLTLFKTWLKIGVFSGMQQFIDNLIYAVMICKMVNMVAEQGNYWVANNFIWGYLLIPIQAMAEIIKRDSKVGYANLEKSNYYLLTTLIILLEACTIPLWLSFYKNMEKLENAKEIFVITVKLAPFYIAYGFSIIIDSIFIGLGKTKYNMINSLIVNFIYYGIFYILYKTSVITFTMNVIILMFGFGMVFHLIVSIVEELIFKKYNKNSYNL